ncbi:MAG: hypothetical protein OXG30_16565 [bacterium]|nr:hypothetical protein [bacterium]
MEGRIAAFAWRPFKEELDAPALQGDFESVCGMVSGTSIDMARDGKQVIAEAVGHRNIDKRS